MHQHDQELIMGLAEESLDPQAAAAARTDVASCQQCTQDLELQQYALSALGGLPESQLTEMESARLRRGLRTELGLTRQTVAARSPQRRRLPLAALATAAAVLIAVVVAGPGLELIGGGSDSDSAPEIVADGPAFAETTAAPTTTAPALLESATPSAAGSQEDTARTTLAPATTTTLDSVDGTLEDDFLGYFSVAPDLSALRDGAAGFGFDREKVRALARQDADDSIVETQEDEAAACIAIMMTSEENLIDGFQIARGEYAGQEVLYVIYVAEDLTESLLIVQVADTCEVLQTVGP